MSYEQTFWGEVKTKKIINKKEENTQNTLHLDHPIYAPLLFSSFLFFLVPLILLTFALSCLVLLMYEKEGKERKRSKHASTK